jgi:HemY protein
MKTLLWIIVLIAAAVGVVAAALHSSTGYVQIVWPPYRVELSMVLVLVLLACAFVAAYLLMRLVSAMVGMPEQVREYRATRRREKAHAALAEALHEFFSGRYARAEKAAAGAIELGAQPGVAAVLAARAAHELRAFERRDQYLDSLTMGAVALPADDIMAVITRADLLLNERRAADAQATLEALPQKHTAAMRIELRALQQAHEWEKTLPLIDQLEKRRVFDAARAADLRRHAYAAQLERRAADRSSVDEAWKKIPYALKKDPAIARAAARCYVALNASEGAGEAARDIIERSLDAEWDSELAALYADCASADTVRQIERAERWLPAHASDAALLLTLGRLCARQELWGKARNYIDASLATEPTYQSHLAAAQLHEKLGDDEAARRHYRQSLDLALVKLRERAAV